MTHFYCSVSLAIDKNTTPYVGLVRGQVRRETKWHPPKQTKKISFFFSSRAFVTTMVAAAAVAPKTSKHGFARRTRIAVYPAVQPLGPGDCNACRCSRFAGGKQLHFHRRWSVPLSQSFHIFFIALAGCDLIMDGMSSAERRPVRVSIL